MLCALDLSIVAIVMRSSTQNQCTVLERQTEQDKIGLIGLPSPKDNGQQTTRMQSIAYEKQKRLLTFPSCLGVFNY